MEDFFSSPLCKSRKYCHQCRTDQTFRSGIVSTFQGVSEVDFQCPHGITETSPDLKTQVKTFARAVFDNAVDAISGKKIFVSDEDKEKRFSICQSCEFLSDTNRCMKCKCNMKIKTTLANQRCPIGKWKRVKQ
jgi:hypothetical protein